MMMDRRRLGAEDDIFRLKTGGSASKGGMSNKPGTGAGVGATSGSKGGASGSGSASKGGMSNKGGTGAGVGATAGGGGKSSGGGNAGKSSGSVGSGGGGKAASGKDKPGFLDGIKSFGSALAAAPGAIARDLSMGATALKGGFTFEGQKAALEKAGYTPQQAQDYIDRTKATIARNEAEAIAAQRDKPDRPFDAAPTSPAMPVAPEEQMPVYRSPFGTAPPIGTTIGRPGPEITPQMRAAALQMFESQRGAGQIPYQMLPYQQGLGSIRREIRPGGRQPGILPIRVRDLQPVPLMSRAPDPFDGMRSTGGDQFMQPAVMPSVMPRMPNPRMPMPQPPMRQNPNVSPAFQYAAQNYQRLGGSQRLMDRPMEMMSAAERRTINDMSRAMAEQAQQQQEYDMGRRLMGKGGGAVGPQPVPMRSDMPMAVGGIAALRPMMTSGTFRRPVGTTGTFFDYIS